MSLRCNSCWQKLQQCGFVTECSHIFCEPCARRVFGARDTTDVTCPLCDTPLQLRSVCQVDYANLVRKTIQLCGLPPKTILEISTKAIDFWQYQKGTEFEYRLREQSTTAQRAAQREKERESELVAANNQINVLQHQLHTTQEEAQCARKELLELKEKYAEKSRQKRKLVELYESLKRRADGGATAISNNNSSGSGNNSGGGGLAVGSELVMMRQHGDPRGLGASAVAAGGGGAGAAAAGAAGAVVDGRSTAGFNAMSTGAPAPFSPFVSTSTPHPLYHAGAVGGALHRVSPPPSHAASSVAAAAATGTYRGLAPLHPSSLARPVSNTALSAPSVSRPLTLAARPFSSSPQHNAFGATPSSSSLSSSSAFSQSAVSGALSSASFSQGGYNNNSGVSGAALLSQNQFLSQPLSSFAAGSPPSSSSSSSLSRHGSASQVSGGTGGGAALFSATNVFAPGSSSGGFAATQQSNAPLFGGGAPPAVDRFRNARLRSPLSGSLAPTTALAPVPHPRSPSAAASAALSSPTGRRG